MTPKLHRPSNPAPSARERATVHVRGAGGTPLARVERLAQLVADVGQPCWVTGRTAAGLHEFDGYALKPPFELLVPRGRYIHRVGHAVHTTSMLDQLDQESVHGIPVISPSRTLLQLAATEPPDRLTAALDGALRDGLTSDDFLHRRVAVWRASGRNGVRPLIAAMDGIEVTRGGHSWLEREFLRLVDVAGLPRPDTQAVVGRRGDRLIRVDVRFRGTNLVVELLGYQWHRSKPQLASDVSRANRLALDGYLLIQFTYPQVVETPDLVVNDVREGLAKAGPRE